MGKVVEFPRKPTEPEINLCSAVEFAIRDLRDIARDTWGATRFQADECRRMLERALEATPLEDPTLHDNWNADLTRARFKG